MKVILTSKIKTLGNIGDIKDVADGYGKNYLLPKKNGYNLLKKELWVVWETKGTYGKIRCRSIWKSSCFKK